MMYAVRIFVSTTLGERFTMGRSVPFATSYEETSRTTGVFFILSPGVNPIKQVRGGGGGVTLLRTTLLATTFHAVCNLSIDQYSRHSDK